MIIHEKWLQNVLLAHTKHFQKLKLCKIAPRPAKIIEIYKLFMLFNIDLLNCLNSDLYNLMRGFNIEKRFGDGQGLTLAELHVCALTNFIKFNKALTRLMKLLPNHIMV